MLLSTSDQSPAGTQQQGTKVDNALVVGVEDALKGIQHKPAHVVNIGEEREARGIFPETPIYVEVAWRSLDDEPTIHFQVVCVGKYCTVSRLNEEDLSCCRLE
eukprot:scaffold169957_cov63-Attheya_sp.AAC.1